MEATSFFRDCCKHFNLIQRTLNNASQAQVVACATGKLCLNFPSALFPSALKGNIMLQLEIVSCMRSERKSKSMNQAAKERC